MGPGAGVRSASPLQLTWASSGRWVAASLSHESLAEGAEGSGLCAAHAPKAGVVRDAGHHEDIASTPSG